MKNEEDLKNMRAALLQLSDELLKVHNELDDKLHENEGEPQKFLQIFMNEVMPINVQLMFLMGRVSFLDFILHDSAPGNYVESEKATVEDIANRYRSMVEKADYIMRHLKSQE